MLKDDYSASWVWKYTLYIDFNIYNFLHFKSFESCVTKNITSELEIFQLFVFAAWFCFILNLVELNFAVEVFLVAYIWFFCMHIFCLSLFCWVLCFFQIQNKQFNWKYSDRPTADSNQTLCTHYVTYKDLGVLPNVNFFPLNVHQFLLQVSWFTKQKIILF